MPFNDSMQNKEIAVFGVTASTSISESVEEMNMLAGRDVAHGLAVNYIDFHVLRSRIRNGVVNALEKLFPSDLRERETSVENDKETTVITEKDTGYVNRLKAIGILTGDQLATVVHEVVASDDCSWAKCLVQKERSTPSLPKKLAEMIGELTSEQKLALASKLSKKLKVEVDGTDDLTLGRAWQAFQKQQSEQMLDSVK